MSTVLVTILVVAPVAFMAGWMLSKALFRHLSLVRPNPVGRHPADDPESDAELRAAFAIQPAQRTPEPAQLQAQLDASRLETEALRNELLLIRQGVAESEQTIHDLKARLSSHVEPPEDTPAAARGKEAAFRRLLSVQQERVNRRDAKVRELQQQVQAARQQLEQVQAQFSQQRSVITELRAQLRHGADQSGQDAEQPAQTETAAPAVASGTSNLAQAKTKTKTKARAGSRDKAQGRANTEPTGRSSLSQAASIRRLETVS